jgi:hypothetical protein
MYQKLKIKNLGTKVLKKHALWIVKEKSMHFVSKSNPIPEVLAIKLNIILLNRASIWYQDVFNIIGTCNKLIEINYQP